MRSAALAFGDSTGQSELTKGLIIAILLFPLVFPSKQEGVEEMAETWGICLSLRCAAYRGRADDYYFYRGGFA